jgi:Tol biopolymer transport system component
VLADQPAWSPSGDRTVYNWASSLWIGSVAAWEVNSVVGNYGRKPAWSPDAARIAYGDERGGISIVALSGGAPILLTTGPDTRPAWSPDGRWIVFSSRRSGARNLWIVAAAGGEPRALTADAVKDDDPSWSPDGRFIAFASDRSGNDDIWVVRVESGALSQVTTDPAADGDPAWSPDGTQIAFTSMRSGYSNIWIASDLRTIAVEPATWSRLKQIYR